MHQRTSNKAFQEMALIVDEQNKHDPNYIPMAPNIIAMHLKPLIALVFEGADQANGYTEDILIKYRRKFLEAKQAKVDKLSIFLETGSRIYRGSILK